MSRGIRISKSIAINLLVLALHLVVTEGLSSYFFFTYGVFNRKPPAERAHTEYDEQLGCSYRVPTSTSKTCMSQACTLLSLA